MRKHGLPKIITTDKLASYGAAFREIGVVDRQLCGGRANNRCENSHLPFRRQEQAMQKFKSYAMLQKFTIYHAQIYNHFNHERHLESRQSFKQKRKTALIEWFNFCAAWWLTWGAFYGCSSLSDNTSFGARRRPRTHISTKLATVSSSIAME